jgi:tetratricopeptide (TPR) repeat protein
MAQEIGKEDSSTKPLPGQVGSNLFVSVWGILAMQNDTSTDVDKLITFGQMALEQGWYDKAREYFQQALELNPASFEAKKGLHQIDRILERRRPSVEPVEIRPTEPIGKRAQRWARSVVVWIRDKFRQSQEWLTQSAQRIRARRQERAREYAEWREKLARQEQERIEERTKEIERLKQASSEQRVQRGSEGGMNRGQILTLLGAIGLLAGAVLPWISFTSMFGTVSKAGYEGDGILTGGIGLPLLLIALLVKGNPGHSYSILGVIFALIAGVIAFWDLSNVSSRVAEINADMSFLASVGPGLYITVIGAILAFVGGLQQVPGQVGPSSSSSEAP